MHYFLRAIKHGTAPWWFGMHPAGLKKVIIRKSEMKSQSYSCYSYLAFARMKRNGDTKCNNLGITGLDFNILFVIHFYLITFFYPCNYP